MRARILIFSSATIISALLRSPPLPPKRPRPRHVTCRFPELLQVFIGHANEQFAFSCDIALDSDRRDPTNIRDCRRGWTACHFTKFSTFHPVPGFQRCRHQSAIYLLPLCRSIRPRMSSVDPTPTFSPIIFRIHILLTVRVSDETSAMSRYTDYPLTIFDPNITRYAALFFWLQGGRLAINFEALQYFAISALISLHLQYTSSLFLNCAAPCERILRRTVDVRTSYLALAA